MRACDAGGMTINRFIQSLILGCFALLACSAAEQKRSEQEAVGEKSRRAAKPASRTAAGSETWEIYAAITLEPGKAVAINPKLDFSTADKVAVSLRLDPHSPSDLTSLELQSYWSVPEAETYSAGETRSGDDFAFLNNGSTMLQVYGSQFRLIVRNIGDADMVIQQIIVFRKSS